MSKKVTLMVQDKILPNKFYIKSFYIKYHKKYEDMLLCNFVDY